MDPFGARHSGGQIEGYTEDAVFYTSTLDNEETLYAYLFAHSRGNYVIMPFSNFNFRNAWELCIRCVEN
jgi:hypothetical protein